MTTSPKRCAIYTRKSTEAGLEQDFNSLHAQREACTAYIKSQKHEGWICVPTEYDDGGFSGGTMGRPALTQLLSDVATGKINVIVVYKVDRLTRSLLDFAKIIELLDRHGASFVSVTQQFNTTTSMGRLTLNVLLSFAQFEREVTSERIRDKIAASKKKGLWMGGAPPLGYDVVDRQLIMNEREAEVVRAVFNGYLKTGTVLALKKHLCQLDLRTKSWTTRSGRKIEGKVFTRGYLHFLLKNPIYIGRIPHKQQSYEGLHQPIVDLELWNAVQQRLKDQWGERKTPANRPSPCWLVGVLHDEHGNRFRSEQTSKSRRLYYYYVTSKKDEPADSGWRLPAREIERIVVAEMLKILCDPGRIIEIVEDAKISTATLTQANSAIKTLQSRLDNREHVPGILRPLLQNIRITQRRLEIEIEPLQFRQLLGLQDVSSQSSDSAHHKPIMLSVPVQLKRRGVEARLILPSENHKQHNYDASLVRIVAKAHVWFEEMRSGQHASIEDIAAAEKIDASDVTRALPLAFLAPSIVQAILDGTQPVDLTAKRLQRVSPLPQDWAEQRRALGF